MIALIGFYYISFLKALFLTKVPYVWTFNWQLDLLKKLNLKKWKIIFDLWCGDWKALRFFARQFWLKWKWYDLNLFAILWGKIINKFYWYDIQLVRQNFYNVDIKEADYLYLYLFPNIMEDVEKWVFKHKRKDSIVIVNSFPFPNKKPFKIIWWKIYLYK